MNHAITNLYPKPVIFKGSGVSGANLTVSTTATLLTALAPAYVNVNAPMTDPARYVTWQVQGGTIYITGDGSVPTATNGFALSPGASNNWSMQYFLAAKAVTSSATAVFRYEVLSD